MTEKPLEGIVEDEHGNPIYDPNQSNSSQQSSGPRGGGLSLVLGTLAGIILIPALFLTGFIFVGGLVAVLFVILLIRRILNPFSRNKSRSAIRVYYR